MDGIEIVPRAALDTATLAAVTGLCARAYEEPFEETMVLFPDATHVLARHDDALVSHAMWVPRRLWQGGCVMRGAYVEAVATEPAAQGRGHATRVLRALGAAIMEFDLGVLSPSDENFYARLGWKAWRGPLLIEQNGAVTPTSGEEIMILRTPTTPALDVNGPLTAPWRPGELW